MSPLKTQRFFSIVVFSLVVCGLSVLAPKGAQPQAVTEENTSAEGQADEGAPQPQESVLLDQYLFLQSKLAGLTARIEQLESQQGTPPVGGSQQVDRGWIGFAAVCVLFVIILFSFYRQTLNQRYAALEERVERVEELLDIGEETYAEDDNDGDSV